MGTGGHGVKGTQQEREGNNNGGNHAEKISLNEAQNK